VDRDGTLIREVGYLSRVEQIEILPGVPEAIELLRRSGFKVAVVTNQSAVARGFITEGELRKIHRELERQLAGHGAFVDGIYYCPHHPEVGLPEYLLDCDCRKPRTGMIEAATKDLEIDVRGSYVVGDKIIDIELAHKAGASGILVMTGYGREELKSLSSERKVWPDHIADDMYDAVKWILSQRETG